MKKSYSLFSRRGAVLLLVSLLLLLSACGQGSPAESPAREPVPPVTEPVTEPEPPTEPEPEPMPPVTELDLSAEAAKARDIPLETLAAEYPQLQALSLEGRDLDSFAFLYDLKELRELNLKGNRLETGDYDALAAALPDCAILWEVPMGDRRIDCRAESLEGEVDPALLGYFPALTYADLRATPMTPEEMAALTAAHPGAELLFSFNFCGVDTDSTATELNIGGNPLEGPEAVLPYLPYLPKLTKLDMCGCGLSNQEMEELMAARPDVKFVWIVSMDVWTLRTDTVAFSSQSSQENPNKITSEDLEVLKYCHDLVALDLGHQAISDLTRIGELENLRILILADNRISDISPLANLKELRYLELFKNYDITDISPLAQLEHLWDINLFYCIGITDFSPFLQMDCIQRLWLSETKCPDAFIAEMNELHPNTVVFRAFRCGATYGGWRDHPRFKAMRDMYEKDYVNELFLSEEGD